MSHVRDIYANNSSSIYLFQTYNLSVTTIKKPNILIFGIQERSPIWFRKPYKKGGGTLGVPGKPAQKTLSIKAIKSLY